MKTSLTKEARKKFADIRLNEQQLEQLQTMIRDDKSSMGIFNYRKKTSWLSNAAVILIALLIGYVSHSVLTGDGKRDQLLYAIATEVADNYIKSKPLDINNHSWQAVDAFFTKLDFKPVDPQLTPLPTSNKLIGGRYCSIQGITALQLRFSSTTGNSTLYQGMISAAEMAAIPNIDNGDKKAYYQLKGLQVSIWQSNSLVFAYIEAANNKLH